MASPALISVRGLTKRFALGATSVHALGPIDLDVHEGEVVSLVGPSGCGKSTLLNVVAGLLRPTTGTILVAGKRVSGTPPEIGMMFQNPVLLEWRTARRNVLLPIEVQHGRRAVREAAPRAQELLDLVGLEGFEDRYPAELSGGMQQRVAICRMLIANPEVLLLDEPFGALDELTREYMNVELERIFASETTEAKAAVFVTHNIQEAVFLSDKVYVMTHRPGTISGVVDVDFARPRPLELMTTAEFQALVREARAFLDGREGTGAVDQLRKAAP